MVQKGNSPAFDVLPDQSVVWREFCFLCEFFSWIAAKCTLCCSRVHRGCGGWRGGGWVGLDGGGGGRAAGFYPDRGFISVGFQNRAFEMKPLVTLVTL